MDRKHEQALHRITSKICTDTPSMGDWAVEWLQLLSNWVRLSLSDLKADLVFPSEPEGLGRLQPLVNPFPPWLRS